MGWPESRIKKRFKMVSHRFSTARCPNINLSKKSLDFCNVPIRNEGYFKQGVWRWRFQIKFKQRFFWSPSHLEQGTRGILPFKLRGMHSTLHIWAWTFPRPSYRHRAWLYGNVKNTPLREWERGSSMLAYVRTRTRLISGFFIQMCRIVMFQFGKGICKDCNKLLWMY